jgi:hypothetical protein
MKNRQPVMKKQPPFFRFRLPVIKKPPAFLPFTGWQFFIFHFFVFQAKNEKSGEKTNHPLAPLHALLYHSKDNPVGILSRVAEGLGPAKPQQPVFLPGRPGLQENAGATSYPADPAAFSVRVRER